VSKARSLVLAGLLTAALSLGLVGAACGDDDEDNGGEPTAPAATEPADGGDATEPADGGEPTEAPTEAPTESAG